MFGLEPPQKRQRLDPTPHASPEPEHTGQPTQPPADNKSTPTVKAWNQSQNPPPSGYQGPSHPSPRPAGAGEPLYSPPNSRYQDGFSQDPGFLASQEELRSILFTFANSAAPTRASSPEADRRDLADTGSASRGSAVSGSSSGSQSYHSAQRGSVPPPPSSARTSPLSSRRRIEYLKNYVAEIAPWLDMFDSRYTFRQQLPALAHSFPALSYAILAISARQMERKSGTQDWCDSLELYQEATRLLSPLLQVCDPKIVAACVLLCCLEMMSARAQDWHRHLEGCAALFDAFGIHGFSQGLLQAVFWCYARMDLCGALISDGTRTTLLHPSKWLPAECQEEDAYRLFKEARSPDMHANYAVYLCMKTTELGANRTKFVELGEENGCTTDVFSSRWTQLWNDLQTWLAERPSELLPVQTLPRKPFPQILFVHWAAISSNQLYHTACILLLKMMPKSLRLTRSHNLSLLWHARRICGISLSNKHHGCLNNAIQPLWIAGRLFSHASEHEQIIKIIRDVEAETGWGACWRIRDLELAWGYNPRRDTANFPSQQFSAPIDQEIVAS